MKIRVLLALVFPFGSLLTLLITSRYTINISPRDKSSVDNSEFVSDTSGRAFRVGDYLSPKSGFADEDSESVLLSNLGPKLIELAPLILKIRSQFQTDGGLTEDQKEILTKGSPADRYQ